VTILVLDVVECENKILKSRIELVKHLSALFEAVIADKIEVLSLLFRYLEEKVAQILHHVLINVLERENLSNSGDRLLRNLL
jgi:hypothetical protein